MKEVVNTYVIKVICIYQTNESKWDQDLVKKSEPFFKAQSVSKQKVMTKESYFGFNSQFRVHDFFLDCSKGSCVIYFPTDFSMALD